MKTLNQIMAAAHEYARQHRAENASYAEALAEGLRRAWAAPAASPKAESLGVQAGYDEGATVYVISGDTYAHRRTLAGLGGEWLAEAKVWVLGPDRKGRCPREACGVRGLDWRRETA